ncbi:Cof-type HAD-IIB family hydrolase [Paenibacillus chartarius]|uniref:Cof-type HAD-IIB family hydrolase n=1 Tax=Paenibacillus chartarius TaxID=747481 RepID=A0ABV6DES8_9BACL
MIKLVAFDVDGTLRERDYMPESTREAVAELKSRGIIVALCTGRSEFEVGALQKELDIEWAITCNGAHIGHKGTTVFGTPFEPELVRHWLDTADENGHGLLLYGAELMLTNRPNDPLFRQAQEEIGFLEPVVLRREDDVPPIYQCIAYVREHEEQPYIGSDPGKFYLHRWRPWAVDINPKGTHKAAGLLRLLDHLGVRREEAAAFGDGFNDVELLEFVGTGIAMGNAPDAVKARARHVTTSMHDDGIRNGVDRYVLS